jgi:hypothetical protein
LELTKKRIMEQEDILSKIQEEEAEKEAEKEADKDV